MTLQEIQERYFEITDDWAAEDPKQQWTSVAELDDLLHELEDVDQPDTPAGAGASRTHRGSDG